MNAFMIFSLSTMIANAPIADFAMPKDFVLAKSADCFSVGEQEAAQLGGTLASANDAVQNGQSVCRVIVVVPGQNGERPKRVEIIVPKE